MSDKITKGLSSGSISLSSSYVSSGYCNYMRQGNVVTIVLDATFKSLSDSGSIIATGLPIPLRGIVVMNLINGSGGGARLLINYDQLKTDYGKKPNAEFYSGSVTYICE